MKVSSTHRKNDLIQLVLSFAILAILVAVSTFAYFKIDLTEEKRHSVTDSTMAMLDELDDIVYIRCYLSGNFPAKFKRLEKSFRERLNEFDDLSNGQFEYEFINIYEDSDEQTIGESEQTLYEEGLRFSRIGYEEGGVRQFQNIWPAAVMTYKGNSLPIQLFQSENPDPSAEKINASVNNLEYLLASNLRILTRKTVPAIAILEGHRELRPLETADLELTLKDNYNVERVEINGKLDALADKVNTVGQRINKYDLLIVAKPDSLFSNKDKLIIDQFIMNGGRVLWMIDPIRTDLDSLKTNQQTLAMTNEMGLYDMLFDYGVRLNRNLIIDYQCAPIVYDAGPMGDRRNMQMFNWYFAPVVIPSDSAHPICTNIDPLHFDFASSLDLVGENENVRKHVLLQSSNLSLERRAPIRVTTAVSNLEKDYFENATDDPYNLAVLLEGEFNSNFVGRISNKQLLDDPDFAFREKSRPTKMIVIGDGDFGRNKFMATEGGFTPLPLGYDRYAGRVVYDNKEFLLNAINYLLDDADLIAIRSRTIILRTLDKEIVKDHKGLIQLLNVTIPFVIIGLMGVVLMWMRKLKYGKEA